MEGISTGLYDQYRSGRDTMTRAGFMLAITVFTSINIIVAGFASTLTYELVISNEWLYLLFVLGCCIVAIGGAFLAHMNDDPMTSIVGGLICAGAMGAMVGPFIAIFEIPSVIQAFAITTVMVLVTGFIGAVMPKDLSMWGAPLFAGLLGLIMLTLAAPLISWLGIDYEFVVSALDVIGIILFSAIMVYDLNVAARIDRTLNNAIDVAVNIFLNFANIFIRLLSLMGEKK